MNPFTQFCRTPWAGVAPIARPLHHTQVSTTQKENANIHSCLEQD